MELLLILGLAFVCAGLSGTIASAKGWESSNWSVAGFFFGPLGLIAAAGLPDRRLRHYLFELSKQQGVASDSLEPQQPRNIDSSSTHEFSFNFKVDEQTTANELWDLILTTLHEDLKTKASRDKSDLNISTARLFIRAADSSFWLRQVESKDRMALVTGLIYEQLINEFLSTAMPLAIITGP